MCASIKPWISAGNICLSYLAGGLRILVTRRLISRFIGPRKLRREIVGTLLSLRVIARAARSPTSSVVPPSRWCPHYRLESSFERLWVVIGPDLPRGLAYALGALGVGEFGLLCGHF
jgi:hypothetical protein